MGVLRTHPLVVSRDLVLLGLGVISMNLFL